MTFHLFSPYNTNAEVVILQINAASGHLNYCARYGCFGGRHANLYFGQDERNTCRLYPVMVRKVADFMFTVPRQNL